MKYPFYTYIDKVEGHTFWVAKSLSLKGCVGQGDTLDDAISELAVNENDWLEEAEESGIAVPVKSEKLYYRGYTADVSYDPQDGIYVGIVDGVPDVLGFHADTLEELPLHFRNCIDDYIEIVTRYKRGSATDGGHEMVGGYEKICLNAVDAVLQKYTHTTWYSIGRAKESAACIEEEDHGWVVYDYERGNRFDINSYDNIVEACLDLIRRVGGKAQSAKLIDIFLSDVIRGDDI